MSDSFWEKHALFIDKYFWFIIIFFVFLSGISLYYASGHLGVNSDTSEMFDESLPFRKEKNRFNKLFPLTQANITVVIEASNPDKLDAITSDFADSLRFYDSLFADVYLPGGGPYFKKNQFLFLSKEKLDSLALQLEQAEPLFSVLAQDYSLRGFFRVLNDALTYADEEQIERLDPLFVELDSTVSSHIKGNDYSMSWQRVMLGNELNENQKRRFIQVKPQRNFENILPAKPAVLKTRELARQFQQQEDVSIKLTGRVVMGFEEMQSVMDGTLIAGLLALVMVSITLWIGLRSLRLIISSILSLVAGLAITVGFSALAVGELNMISVAFAVLYIGLGIDYAIHFSLKFKELRYHKHPFRESLNQTFKKLSLALGMSTISTSLAFYSFIPTSFDGVSELGIIAGTGMFISLAITFTLLPSLLKLFRSHTMQASEVTLSVPYADFIAPFMNKHTRKIKIAGILSGVLSIILLPKVKFDYNPINLRDDKSESVRTMNMLMSSDNFSAWSIDIIADDKKEALALKDSLSGLPHVGRILTVESFIPNNQKEKLPVLQSLQPLYADMPEMKLNSDSIAIRTTISEIEFFIEQVDFYETPSQSLEHLKSTLQSLLESITEMSEESRASFLQSLETKLLSTLPGLINDVKIGLTASEVSAKDLPENIRARWVSKNGQYRVEVTPDDNYDDTNEQLRNFAASVRQFTDRPTGNLITAIESGDAVVAAFNEALIYAFFVITLIIFLFLRSIKETFYILLPLILMGIMTGAAMVLLDIPFNFANIIALPMIMGLGVDNGIHIVHRSVNHHNNEINMLKTSTARAILFSSLTTLLSFGNLAFSPHNGTASLGIILTLGLLFMMFATLVVLPAFLIKKSVKVKID